MTSGVDAIGSAGSREHPEALLLAEAKLAPPRLRPGLLVRSELQRTLDDGGQAALTLVAAPAGYGKTTTVREWCAARGSALAWVTLDAQDNDPVQLWRYIATAVERVRRGLGDATLRRLRQVSDQLEAPVDELMNGIAAFGQELIIVLDDLETVTSKGSIASLDYALTRLPPCARMIVLTRRDPGLRLAQLRARGSLAELRAQDLAFTVEETRRLIVERAGISLGDAEIGFLHERTEGWPAALLLATLWLRSVGDPQRAVHEFRADQRFVADYLSDEVLMALDEELRSFLLRVSVLGRFTPEMCDDVLRRSDSASLVEELERLNLFTTRLEQGGWFRIHPLFAEFARFHLAALDPEAAAEIHRRAADWLRFRRQPVEALRHAAESGDDELVAQILIEYHLVLIRNGSWQTLVHWVKSRSDEVVVDHPILATAAATAVTLLGGSGLERRRFLALADRSRAERPDLCDPLIESAAKTVRAMALEGGVAQALWDGRSAVSSARAGADELMVSSLAAYARALYQAGEIEEARNRAIEALEHPDVERRPPEKAFARTTLALIALESGQLRAARAHAEKGKAIVGGIGSSRSWLGAHAAAALGSVLAAEGDLAQAERELVYAERFFRDDLPSVHHAWLHVLLARVRVRRGRLEAAEDAMSAARVALAELGDAGRVPQLAAEVEDELEEAKRRASGGEILEPLSAAELAVLSLLESDLSAPQIAAEMFLSPNTVRSHTRSIYRKLGVNSRIDAVARAEAADLLARTESPM